MIISEFLGFVTNHERIAKYSQQAIEQKSMRIEPLCWDINYYNINDLLKKDTYDIKDIKAALNHFKKL